MRGQRKNAKVVSVRQRQVGPCINSNRHIPVCLRVAPPIKAVFAGSDNRARIIKSDQL